MRYDFKGNWSLRGHRLAVWALFFVVMPLTLHAQNPGGISSALTNQTISQPAVNLTGVSQSSPLLGSVPQGAATRQELPLSLAEAISRGLRFNLGAILSSQDARAVQGARLLALSQLLPSLSAQLTQSSQQINLAALGFSSFPGIPQIIGPFSVSDVRANLHQSLLNFSAIRNYQAAGQETKAADFSSLDTREMVVVAVTSLYLLALSGHSRLEAAAAQVSSAEAIFKQADDFKQAGVVPAIEVLRAQVQLQAEQQRLIYDRNEFE
jgi:outer membrane protein TolC